MVTIPLPQIEGFQPIPNAVMIPFMETQSAALAFGFGLNYEYGKRTIRSMSNETFNSLTSEQIAEMSANHSTILLNRFIQAVPQVMPAQTEIFKQYVEIEKAKVVQNIDLAKWIVDYVAKGTNEGIEQFFGNLFGTNTQQPQSIQQPLPPVTLPPERPLNIPTKVPTKPTATSGEIQHKHLIDLKVQELDAVSKRSKTISNQNKVKLFVAQLYNLRVQFKERYGYWY